AGGRELCPQLRPRVRDKTDEEGFTCMREFCCSAKVRKGNVAARKSGGRLRCARTATLHYYGYNPHLETFTQFFRCERHRVDLHLPEHYKVESIEAWTVRVLEQKIKYAADGVALTAPVFLSDKGKQDQFERKIFECEAKLLWNNGDKKVLVK